MRKLTCFLAAFVVGTVATLHFAAHVAVHHPRSRFAYGFTTSYEVAEQLNPLSTLYRWAAVVSEYALADQPQKQEAHTLVASSSVLASGKCCTGTTAVRDPELEAAKFAKFNEAFQTALGDTKLKLGAEADGDEACDNSPEVMLPSIEDEELHAGPTPTSETDTKTEEPTTATTPGSHEEAESIHEETPPACQEDPSYHHHYPGCPHTVVCPYTGKSYPVEDEPIEHPKVKKRGEEISLEPCPEDGKAKKAATPVKRRKHKDKAKETTQGTESVPQPIQPAKYIEGYPVFVEPTNGPPVQGSPDSPSCPAGGCEKGKKCPKNEGVDTMEFRPSDAAQGEFDVRPL